MIIIWGGQGNFCNRKYQWGSNNCWLQKFKIMGGWHYFPFTLLRGVLIVLAYLSTEKKYSLTPKIGQCFVAKKWWRLEPSTWNKIIMTFGIVYIDAFHSSTYFLNSLHSQIPNIPYTIYFPYMSLLMFKIRVAHENGLVLPFLPQNVKTLNKNSFNIKIIFHFNWYLLIII